MLIYSRRRNATSTHCSLPIRLPLEGTGQWDRVAEAAAYGRDDAEGEAEQRSSPQQQQYLLGFHICSDVLGFPHGQRQQTIMQRLVEWLTRRGNNYAVSGQTSRDQCSSQIHPEELPCSIPTSPPAQCISANCMWRNNSTVSVSRTQFRRWLLAWVELFTQPAARCPVHCPGPGGAKKQQWVP